jgi:hypothetical protein
LGLGVSSLGDPFLRQLELPLAELPAKKAAGGLPIP